MKTEMNEKLRRIEKLLDRTESELDKNKLERRVILVNLVNKYNDIWSAKSRRTNK